MKLGMRRESVVESQINFLMQAVEQGMLPWRPQTVNTYCEFDIDFNRYRILFEAIGPGWCFSVYIYVDAFDIAYDEEWVWKAYPRVVHGFRNRTTLPLPAKITLGEN